MEAIIALAAVLLLVVGGTLFAWLLGYKLGGDVVVRCREGHLFTTIWVPFGSFKAIRLGLIRFQRCPVGDHLTFVTPVRDSHLTDRERRIAAQYHDVRVP